jgi:hypothetical protein
MMDISSRYGHSHDQRYRTETPTTGCFIRLATRIPPSLRCVLCSIYAAIRFSAFLVVAPYLYFICIWSNYTAAIGCFKIE